MCQNKVLDLLNDSLLNEILPTLIKDKILFVVFSGILRKKTVNKQLTSHFSLIINNKQLQHLDIQSYYQELITNNATEISMFTQNRKLHYIDLFSQICAKNTNQNVQEAHGTT